MSKISLALASIVLATVALTGCSQSAPEPAAEPAVKSQPSEAPAEKPEPEQEPIDPTTDPEVRAAVEAMVAAEIAECTTYASRCLTSVDGTIDAVSYGAPEFQSVGPAEYNADTYLFDYQVPGTATYTYLGDGGRTNDVVIGLQVSRSSEGDLQLTLEKGEVKIF